MIDFTDELKGDVSEFRGKKYISIRKWYKGQNGELLAGKSGINMTEEEWNSFLGNFENFKNYVQEKVS